MKLEDLTGKTFGSLKVIKRDTDTKSRHTKWICECLVCGKIVSVQASNLKDGNSTNCGCQRNKATSERCRKMLDNQVFGKCVALQQEGVIGGHLIYRCKCLICGKEFTAYASNLIQGKTVSCGCVNKENTANGRQKTLDEAKLFKTNVGRIRSQSVSCNNTTGTKGVCYLKSLNQYRAYITFQGKRYILKTSKDINTCIEMRKEAEKQLFGNFLEWYDRQTNKKIEDDK